MSDSDNTAPESRPCSRCGGPMQKKPTESGSAFKRRKTCGCKKTDAGMAPTEGKPHLSRYAGGYISHAQFLAEIMCERRAGLDRRQLPLRFWDNKDDGVYFMKQLRAANTLLERYGPEAVLSGVNLPEAKKCYSLTAPWLAPILFKEAERLKKLREPSNPVSEVTDLPVKPTIVFQPPPNTSPANLLTRLRGKSGGQKEV